jgi:hypothetical protein
MTPLGAFPRRGPWRCRLFLEDNNMAYSMASVHDRIRVSESPVRRAGVLLRFMVGSNPCPISQLH